MCRCTYRQQRQTTYFFIKNSPWSCCQHGKRDFHKQCYHEMLRRYEIWQQLSKYAAGKCCLKPIAHLWQQCFGSLFLSVFVRRAYFSMLQKSRKKTTGDWWIEIFYWLDGVLMPMITMSYVSLCQYENSPLLFNCPESLTKTLRIDGARLITGWLPFLMPNYQRHASKA